MVTHSCTLTPEHREYAYIRGVNIVHNNLLIWH